MGPYICGPTVAVGLDAALRCDAEICHDTHCACSSCVFGGLSAELQLKARLPTYVLSVFFVFFMGRERARETWRERLGSSAGTVFQLC